MLVGALDRRVIRTLAFLVPSSSFVVIWYLGIIQTSYGLTIYPHSLCAKFFVLSPMPDNSFNVHVFIRQIAFPRVIVV